MPTNIFRWQKSDIQHNFVILGYIFLCWESEQLLDGTCVIDLCGTTIPPPELQLNTYQKLCPHFVMCTSSIISKQMGLEKQKGKKAVLRTCQTSTFKHLKRS